MTDQPPAKPQAQHPAAIEVAALHLARIYGGGDTSDAALQRWAGRIRVWAHRFAGELGDYGREGRSRIYDLTELRAIADRVLPPKGPATPRISRTANPDAPDQPTVALRQMIV